MADDKELTARSRRGGEGDAMSHLSKCELLHRYYGGNWEYKGFAGWVSDDGRFVRAVSNGVDEFDNPIGGPYLYHMYGHGKSELVDWHKIATIVEKENEL